MRTLVASIALVAVALAITASAPAAGSLTGTVGPGFTITLKQGGKVVKKLAPGKYTFVIQDKSNIHNFHLTGPGLNKSTTVPFVGNQTWHLTLKAGTYKYVCDPHKTIMHGTFTVT